MMTHPSDLVELRGRLAKATGPDRSIDGLLWRLSEPEGDWVAFGETSDVLHKRDPDDRIAFEPPPYFTASIDAALSLVERVLPGWRWMVRSHEGGATAYVSRDPVWNRVHHADRTAATGPLAILDAALTALSQLTGE